MNASDVAARRIREARTKRGWTVKQLAAECAKAGTPQITAPVITNLETRRRLGREITAEELVALAWVLGVPPVQLLTPLGTNEALQVVPGESMGPLDLVAWVADDIPPSQLIFLTARDENDRPLPVDRSVLPVVRHFNSNVWRIRRAARTLVDEEWLKKSSEPASHHEESIRRSADWISSAMAYLRAAGHDVALPDDVAEIIDRYSILVPIEDELEESNGPRL